MRTALAVTIAQSTSMPRPARRSVRRPARRAAGGLDRTRRCRRLECSFRLRGRRRSRLEALAARRALHLERLLRQPDRVESLSSATRAKRSAPPQAGRETSSAPLQRNDSVSRRSRIAGLSSSKPPIAPNCAARRRAGAGAHRCAQIGPGRAARCRRARDARLDAVRARARPAAPRSGAPAAASANASSRSIPAGAPSWHSGEIALGDAAQRFGGFRDESTERARSAEIRRAIASSARPARRSRRRLRAKRSVVVAVVLDECAACRRRRRPRSPRACTSSHGRAQHDFAAGERSRRRERGETPSPAPRSACSRKVSAWSSRWWAQQTMRAPLLGAPCRRSAR